MPPGIVILFIGIALVILILILRKRKSRGGNTLVAFSVALAIWTCAYGLLRFGPASSGQVWVALIYLCATAASTALLTFIFVYTNHANWLGRWSFYLLCLEPLATQVLFWVFRWQGFFSVDHTLTKTGIVLNSSPWYWINATYSDGLMILAIILVSRSFLLRSKPYKSQALIILIGLCIPILIHFVSLTAYILVLNLEPPLVSYTITGLFLVYNLYRFEELGLEAIPREEVVESMRDGWMVLDPANRIVDLNPAAERLIGMKREQALGKPADKILENWPMLGQEPSMRELETKGSILVRGELRSLSVRILPLIRQREPMAGRVVLWRDITERRMSDNARQRARDDMFALLHSISSTAFNTLSMSDFLVEASSQIMYSFQSQASLIFLLEDGNASGGKPKYYLATHIGIPDDMLGHLSSSAEIAEIMEHLLESREPFLVPFVSKEPRFPPAMQQSISKSLVMVPMFTGEQVLGVIGLIRKSGPPFGKDESTRLAIVGDDLASFIRGDRQRQMAIALEERNRLVHDLHDSVTQKLYGLLMLTQAEQDRLEKGLNVEPSKLAKINANARQALKEMRMFLFQMKPVDLERSGLVAVLHERLEAVEGQADIKARLMADDEINLSLEKATMLYYVAQEALNNVTKHAKASSVTIYLKKQKKSAKLEVVDDGCGFDQEAIKKESMGLRIMQERVAKIGGKLSIKSIPGKGTRITVTIGGDKVSPLEGEEKDE